MHEADIDGLRLRLTDAGYTLDAVLDRLGEAGRRGLDRNSTVPARDALVGDDPQATLARLWILQDPISDASARVALGSGVDALAGAGLLHRSNTARGDGWVASAVIRPYGAQATASTPEVAGWICHDPLPNLDTRALPPRPDHVLGISPASTTLAQLTIRTPAARALDLGTGCGVQTLHLATHCADVVATDLNPRALKLARVTTGLSGVAADLRLGDLYAPVAGEGFDLIVSNPPFVMTPPADGERLTYREGNLPGDELVRRVVVDGARRLNPGGTMQVLCNWAITDEPWEERLAGWLRPTGCDALVLQRERLDPYEYVEVWLSDAGLDGADDYDRRYRDWLDYLEATGIVGVGMGWISVRNAGRVEPSLRLEDWPFGVHQPLGEALAAQQRGVDALRSADDAALLATRWRVEPGLVQETMGRPGAADPEHIVLRQSYGLGRALQAHTALAAFVGACDGELSASEIIGAIAHIEDVDAAELTSELLPRLTELIADGYFVVGP